MISESVLTVKRESYALHETLQVYKKDLPQEKSLRIETRDRVQLSCSPYPDLKLDHKQYKLINELFHFL